MTTHPESSLRLLCLCIAKEMPTSAGRYVRYWARHFCSCALGKRKNSKVKSGKNGENATIIENVAARDENPTKKA